MADVTLTPAAVFAVDGAVVHGSKTSGGAVPAGRIVRRNTSGLFVLAQADTLANSGTRAQLYIALNTSGASGQPIDLLEEGDLTCDGLTQGKAYWLSTQAGGLLMPTADMVLDVGSFAVYVGFAVSTTVLRVKFANSGVAIV